MKPIRILQVVTIMNRGGLETMLMNYYRKVDRSQIQFDFMVHRLEEGHYDAEIERLGGIIYRMPSIRPGNYLKYFRELDQFFEENKQYKVVHSHINENSSFVLRAAKKAGITARFAHSHLSNLGVDKKLPFRLYARYLMKGAPSHYFACSKEAGSWLFGQKSLHSGEIHVINNAINVNEFKYSSEVRNSVRRELQLENKLVIGHVGRFTNQKNHSFLIDIFRELLKYEPEALLMMIGAGPLLKEIEGKVEKYGLSKNIKFLGLREDIAGLMQAMDLFLFPSLFEGLPVVLVEAQASGLNCIVSDTITKECDVTGRVHFESLNNSAESWAKKLLTTSHEHIDTSYKLEERGYDTGRMARWLTEYYQRYHNVS